MTTGATQASAIKAAVSFERPWYPTATTEEAILCYTISANTATTPIVATRPPIKITLVLDCSISMGTSFKVLQEAACGILDKLNATDMACIIFFGVGVYSSEFMMATEANKTVLRNFINAQDLEAATFLAGGLVTATETTELEEFSGNTLVFLLTDGEGNRWTSLLKSYPDMAAYVAAHPNITYHTFGFTAGHDGTKLATLASPKGGSYTYITRAPQIKEAFDQIFQQEADAVCYNLEVTFIPTDPDASVRAVSTTDVVSASHPVTMRIKSMDAGGIANLMIATPLVDGNAVVGVFRLTAVTPDEQTFTLFTPAEVMRNDAPCHVRDAMFAEFRVRNIMSAATLEASQGGSDSRGIFRRAADEIKAIVDLVPLGQAEQLREMHAQAELEATKIVVDQGARNTYRQRANRYTTRRDTPSATADAAAITEGGCSRPRFRRRPASDLS